MQSRLHGLAENATEATEAARANLSPRARELETLERYATGRQYEGLPDWFDDSLPLWERAPCIVYNIAGVAIRSNCHLVLGEGRFPVITSNPGENDSEADGLDEATSKKVDRALSELSKRTRFRSICRQALMHAQQAKSVAIITGVRAGKPFMETVRSRWCEPKFDIHRNVVSLEIRYPYIDWQKQPDGKWKLKAKLYRRVIDAKSDTTYLPLDADKNGRDPIDSDWQPNPDLTVQHNLGFCPVHWYAHMRECSTVADYDGEAIHQEALDEIRGLDFALSQRHRAALFCGDPQIIECGVDAGHNPSGVIGRASGVPSTYAGGTETPTNPVTGTFRDPGARAARLKSPGVVWQYENPATKVAYLVLPPEALGVLDAHAADLRNKIAEMLSVVILDPQNVKNTADMSGKAIEQLRARQFDRCDEIREDVEENLLLPLTKLMLRVALATKIAIKAVAVIRDVLQRFVDDDQELMLFTRWPSGYVKPDPTDEMAIVKVAATAKDASIITKRMALEKVAPLFGVDNVDQAEAALLTESKQNDAALHGAMQALGGNDPGPNAGAVTDDPKPTDDVSGAAVPAPDKSPAGGQAGTSAAGKAPVMRAPKSAAPPSKPLSQAGTSTAGIAETVYQQLLEDYPTDSLKWVRAATWDGPMDVPLDQVDFSNRDKWQASQEPDRIQFFVDKIQAGDMKPVVLVNEPNNNKLIIIDGHHRSLAYEQLQRPIRAFVATVGTVKGPWDEMHASQRDGDMQYSRQSA